MRRRGRGSCGNLPPSRASVCSLEATMSATIDRRRFLKQAAAASLILGFPVLAAGQDQAEVVLPADPVQQPVVGKQPFTYRTPSEIKPVAPDELVGSTLKRLR